MKSEKIETHKGVRKKQEVLELFTNSSIKCLVGKLNQTDYKGGRT